MAVKSLFIASLEPKAGSLIVSMGIMQLLKSRLERVAFFRPIVEHKDDSDIHFMIQHFNLEQSYEESYVFEIEEVEELLSDNHYHHIIETLIAKYHVLEAKYDFVLIEGLNRDRFSKALEFNINHYIAKNLQSPYISVINGKNKSFSDLRQEIQIERASLIREHTDPIAIFANRLDEKRHQKLSKKCIKGDIPTFFLPEIEELDMPTVGEIMHALSCKLLLGEPSDLDRIVRQSKIAAMNIEHILGRFEDGDLIIVPGDRLDIILTSLSANYSKDFPSISGILLTGDIAPAKEFLKLISGLSFFNIPILSIESDTYETIMCVNSVPAKIRPNRERKIALAMGNFMDHVDVELLRERVVSSVSLTTTPEMFEYSLYERASEQHMRIVLPESSDERILRAAEILLRRNIVDIILLGNPEEIEHQATTLGLDISRASIIEPSTSSLLESYTQKFLAMRAHKGLTLDAAADAMVNDTYFATMMIQEGDADGMVPDISLVSSLFLMCLETKVLIYADCAVNQDPSAEDLAQIAIASAKSALAFGIEPRIAMLSYSTGDSGKGDDVEKVRRATKIAQKMRPDLLIEGPIQYDAAIDPKIAHKKLPNSKVAGQATVYIFPDLNTGNNTYKAVQRSSGAIAIGPILQGLKKPVNDLSRGCEIADIVNTVLITAIQAQKLPQ